MRCQLQIYTPPLAHCTSLKPEAACSGFISVPAHTGCVGPHTLIYLSCLCETSFAAEREKERERDGSTQDLRMYEMKFILGRRHETPLTEKWPFLLPSLLPPLCLPAHGAAIPSENRWWMFMCTSKYTSVTPASTSFVVYFSVIVLLVLLSTMCSLLSLFLVICHYFNLLFSWSVTFIFKSKCDSKWAMNK